MVHETALVSDKATLGENVSIGAYTIVHDNTVISDGTTIGSHCEIGCPTELADGSPLIIGKDSLIRSHNVFYQGSVFGDNLETGHRVTAREGTKAGANLRIGTLSDCQGDCEIGDYVRLHSGVHIGKHSVVGNYVWVLPHVILTNDPHPPSEVQMGVTLRDFSVIAVMSVILPGVTVGEHSLVAASSMVARDVKPHTAVSGNPARVFFDISSIKLKDGSDENAYPWPRHFHRGYPDSVIKKWIEEYK